MTAKRTGTLALFSLLFLAIELQAKPMIHCGAFGAQFNLEPAKNAVPQQFETVDFIPNRVGLNQDLVVGGAFDGRGGTTLASVSGYYVHRSTSGDCGLQFEGGLPSIVSGAATYHGIGGVAIAADAKRDGFFAADLRLSGSGNSLVTAIGLFRAASRTLLNPTLCANGTHTAAQSKSCWEATAPVVVDAQSPNFNQVLDYPSLAVDERDNLAGVGAGDVYLAFQGLTATGGITLVACTNLTLSCSTPKIVSASSEPVAVLGTGNAYVQVRPDGYITVTYLDSNSVPSETVRFVLCKPAGAPKAPVCSAPTTVATENQALGGTINIGTLSGLNQTVFTAARHADRLEADGKTVTTFVVWDRCQTYFGSGSNNGFFATCLNAQVLLSESRDGGSTWSTPVPVNTTPGHQFFPAISVDDSTGTVNIGYYNSGNDRPFHKRIVVSLNQIARRGTTISSPIDLTEIPMPWDADPSNDPLPLDFFDFHFGMKARGMGTAGFSRVYACFTSTADRPGSYSGQPLSEQNNNLQKLTY